MYEIFFRYLLKYAKFPLTFISFSLPIILVFWIIEAKFSFLIQKSGINVVIMNENIYLILCLLKDYSLQSNISLMHLFVAVSMHY